MMGTYLIFGGLLLWALSLWYLRWYVKKRTEPARILEKLEAEVAQLVREIDATTDRDITLIEERVKQLKALLEETDRRIVSYKREVERRLQEERAYQELGRRAKSSGGVSQPASPSKGAGVLFPELEVPVPSSPKMEENALASPEGSPRRLSSDRPQGDIPQASPQNGPLQRGPLPGTVETALPFPRGNSSPMGTPSFSGEGADRNASDGVGKTEQRGPSAEPEKGPSSSRPFPAFVRSSEPIQPKPPPLGEQVLGLYRSGISPDVIAKKLGVTVAEVELALTVEARRQQEKPLL
ncbi:MAG TPA: hypothetical protein PLW34_05775 [Termitinemataceae bacterium]|nr:hypothetical protein [Termitinemataceae bacterium]HOM22930.1 hypothetical protein [Termitinemataceae bacterium]HPQ00271.1 hypothetical protein [Termitinemataceae bacterium]